MVVFVVMVRHSVLSSLSNGSVPVVDALWWRIEPWSSKGIDVSVGMDSHNCWCMVWYTVVVVVVVVKE